MTVPVKSYPTIGVCGLDCGLCPRYYTVGESRCPGCCGPDFFNKRPSCSFITCCVKKRKLEVCGECEDFPCSKFKTQAQYDAIQGMAYPPNRKVLPNLNFIREKGIARFVAQQKQRMTCLKVMLEDFDDGRSKSFYCRVAALLDPQDLRGTLQGAKEGVRRSRPASVDPKARARILRELLVESARRQGIDLR